MPTISETNPCAKHEWRYAGRWDGPHEGCEQPTRLVCVNCSTVTAKRCQTARASRCKPCGNTYRRSVHHVAKSGTLLSGRTYFATFTARGVRVHRHRKWDCPCTTEANKLDSEAAIAEWNASCVARWNRLHQHLERRLGVKLAAFKGVEVQKRGVLHLHVLFRVDKPCKVRVSLLRALAMRHGFGHEVDLQEVSSTHAAWYVAKYVSKSCDQRELAPFLDRATGEIGAGRWRAWTSTRGQRRWGTSMGEVRAAQAAWGREQRGEQTGSQGASGAQPADPGAGAAGALDPNCASYASPAGQEAIMLLMDGFPGARRM